jgi:Uma2 family endonuclease
VVICGEPQFHGEYRDVVLNPTAIIEVLSPSTEAFDRGEKRLRYQTWLPSLTHYVLVAQGGPQVEHYLRQSTGEWLYPSVKGLEGTLHLAAVDCTLRLRSATASFFRSNRMSYLKRKANVRNVC